MKTLFDVLAEKRAVSLAAASFRDERVAKEGLDKIAAKTPKALGMISKLREGIKARKLRAQLLETAGEARTMALGQVLKKGPVKTRQGWAQWAKDVGDLERSLVAPGVDKKQLMFAAVGVGSIGFAAKDVHDRLKIRSNLAAIEKDPMIPAKLKPRAREVFKVLQRYAPSLAKDPTMSRDFTRNLIRHDVIDHNVVKDLAHTEKEVQETRKKTELLQKGMSFAAGMGA